MRINRLGQALGWYQRKIGAYDSQAWECSVEQKIIRGLNHATFTKKSNKPRTQLIDVDLVRGSLFPKAKPTQGLLTVARLGLERALFLPLHCAWWARHTSGLCVCALLILYASLLAGLSLYASTPVENETDEQRISTSVLIAPAAVFIILSILHSHIVATQMPSTKMNSRNGMCERRPTPKRPTEDEVESQSSSEADERFQIRPKVKVANEYI